MDNVPIWWWLLASLTMVAVIVRTTYLMGYTIRQPRNALAVLPADDIPAQHRAPAATALATRVDHGHQPAPITPPPAPAVEVIERETIIRERITRPAAPQSTDLVKW